jgi:hypothetical protein
MEYLTDEEKTIIEEIKAKAEKRAKKAQLIAQIEEWTKKMEELGDEE